MRENENRLKQAIQNDLEEIAKNTNKESCGYASWLTRNGKWFNHPFMTDHYEIIMSRQHGISSLDEIPDFKFSGSYGKMRLAHVYTDAIRMKCVGKEMSIGIHAEQDPPNKMQVNAIKNQFCSEKYKTLRLDVLSRRSDSGVSLSTEINKDDDVCDKAVDKIIKKFSAAREPEYNID